MRQKTLNYFWSIWKIMEFKQMNMYIHLYQSSISKINGAEEYEYQENKFLFFQ